jgi:hypothetical protein
VPLEIEDAEIWRCSTCSFTNVEKEELHRWERLAMSHKMEFTDGVCVIVDAILDDLEARPIGAVWLQLDELEREQIRDQWIRIGDSYNPSLPSEEFVNNIIECLTHHEVLGVAWLSETQIVIKDRWVDICRQLNLRIVRRS